MASAKKFQITKTKTLKFVCKKYLKYGRSSGKTYCSVSSLKSRSVAQTRKYLREVFIQSLNSKPALASPESTSRIVQRKAKNSWKHLNNCKALFMKSDVLPSFLRGELFYPGHDSNMVINYLLKASKGFLISNFYFNFKSETQDPNVSKAIEISDGLSTLVDTPQECFSSQVDSFDCPFSTSSQLDLNATADQEEINLDPSQTQVTESLFLESEISSNSQLQFSHFVQSEEQRISDLESVRSNVSPTPALPAELAPLSTSSIETHPGASVNIKAPQTHSSPNNVSIYEQLGIIVEKPKRTEFALRARRQETFGNWPEQHFLKPEVLAAAGFYYGGRTDSVRCFFCGGGLRNWEEGDDIWVEHARWFPKCAYLKQHVSQQFVNTVQELKSDKQITLNQVLTTMGINKALEKDNDNSEIVRDPAVKSVTELGYKEEEVIRVASQIKTQENTLSSSTLSDKLRRSVQENLSECSAETANVIRCLQEKNCRLRQQFRCKICMDKDVEVVFLPCGHLVSCSECASALKDCPVCRKFVKGTVRVFLC